MQRVHRGAQPMRRMRQAKFARRAGRAPPLLSRSAASSSTSIRCSTTPRSGGWRSRRRSGRARTSPTIICSPRTRRRNTSPTSPSRTCCPTRPARRCAIRSSSELFTKDEDGATARCSCSALRPAAPASAGRRTPASTKKAARNGPERPLRAVDARRATSSPVAASGGALQPARRLSPRRCARGRRSFCASCSFL